MSKAAGKKHWMNCTATDLNPFNPAWHFNIGLTLDELGRTEEAIDAYQHVLQFDPDDLPALNHLGADFTSWDGSGRPWNASRKLKSSIQASKRVIATVFSLIPN